MLPRASAAGTPGRALRWRSARPSRACRSTRAPTARGSCPSRTIRSRLRSRSSPGSGAVHRAVASPWTGLYVGGHVAYGVAQTGDTLSTTAPSSASDSLGSFSGGVELGYERRLPSHLLLGVEGDVEFPYFVQDGAVVSRAAPQGSLTGKLDFVSTGRARIGYALGARGQWVFYAPAASRGRRPGWSRPGRAGRRARPSDTRSAGPRAREPSSRSRRAGASEPSCCAISWRHHRRRPAAGARPALRLERRGERLVADPLRRLERSRAIDVHRAGLPSRSARPTRARTAYSGATQVANTLSATAFLGLRLWQGAELYFEPEIDQGFGLSQTLGVAAFPNGEAQKAAYPVPRLNLDRVIAPPDHSGSAASRRSSRTVRTSCPGDATSRASRSRQAGCRSATPSA